MVAPLLIIGADDVVRRRRCCDHFVTMYVSGCVGMCVWGVCYHDKTKTPDRNELKLGAIIGFDILSKLIDYRFKRSRVMGRGSSFRTFGTSCHRANKTDYYILRKLHW